MGLAERLLRLEREAELAEAPSPQEYLAAHRRETARRLRGVYERLARIPGDGPPVSHLGARHPDRELLADDTVEQAETDRRTVEAWERANGAPDIRSHAEEARARLLEAR